MAQLRVGAAKAQANLLVMHPSDWSKVRRSKDAQGRYLVAPDPTSGEASTVWGVEVFTTTAQTSGSAFMLDTSKFGKVLVRDSLRVLVGTSGDDLVRNLTRFVVEERLALAVERPAAVLKLSGL
nr:phage major capsid protein [Gordonia asplenii]